MRRSPNAQQKNKARRLTSRARARGQVARLADSGGGGALELYGMITGLNISDARDAAARAAPEDASDAGAGRGSAPLRASDVLRRMGLDARGRPLNASAPTAAPALLRELAAAGESPLRAAAAPARLRRLAARRKVPAEGGQAGGSGAGAMPGNALGSAGCEPALGTGTAEEHQAEDDPGLPGNGADRSLLGGRGSDGKGDASSEAEGGFVPGMATSKGWGSWAGPSGREGGDDVPGSAEDSGKDGLSSGSGESKGDSWGEEGGSVSGGHRGEWASQSASGDARKVLGSGAVDEDIAEDKEAAGAVGQRGDAAWSVGESGDDVGGDEEDESDEGLTRAERRSFRRKDSTQTAEQRRERKALVKLKQRLRREEKARRKGTTFWKQRPETSDLRSNNI